jgi:putative tryptophan/tyrosine transport system substrate-binding protein
MAVKRRDFIVVLGGAAAWPFAVRAQPTKNPAIGFLGTTTPAVWREPVAAFEKRLGELGWVPGRTITIDYQWTLGHDENALQIAKDFVARKVDVMVVGGNAVAAAKQATTTIPIVFPVAVDPVGSGFVANLSHPGGNVTGLSMQGPDAAGKRLEMLRSISPGLHRVAIMVDVGYPAAKKELETCQAAAQTMGLETIVLAVRQPADIEPAMDSLHDKPDALYVVADALTSANQNRIATLALGARLPTLFGNSDSMSAGGLLAYGPNIPDLFRRAAEMVDKILHGTKPGDIPVEQPTKFNLVINMTTAKALGLTVPPNLLALADEVIE